MRHPTQPRNPFVSHISLLLLEGSSLFVYPFGGRRANERDFLKLGQGKVKKFIIRKEKEVKNGEEKDEGKVFYLYLLLCV